MNLDDILDSPPQRLPDPPEWMVDEALDYAITEMVDLVCEACDSDFGRGMPPTDHERLYGTFCGDCSVPA